MFYLDFVRFSECSRIIRVETGCPLTVVSSTRDGCNPVVIFSSTPEFVC